MIRSAAPICRRGCQHLAVQARNPQRGKARPTGLCRVLLDMLPAVKRAPCQTAFLHWRWVFWPWGAEEGIVVTVFGDQPQAGHAKSNLV